MQSPQSLVGLLALLTISVCTGYATKGSLQLDDRTFDKVVDGSRPVLVKFDKKYSTSHIYRELSEAVAASSSRLLLCEVGVADYGELENESLATRFKLGKGDFPAFLFFKEGSTDHELFGTDTETAEDMVRALRTRGVNMGLVGTVKEMDATARELMRAAEPLRKDILQEAEKVATQVISSVEKDSPAYEATKNSVEYYTRIMKQVIAYGTGILDKERQRLLKLQSDKSVTGSQKNNFARRMNILTSFTIEEE